MIKLCISICIKTGNVQPVHECRQLPYAFFASDITNSLSSACKDLRFVTVLTSVSIIIIATIVLIIAVVNLLSVVTLLITI